MLLLCWTNQAEIWHVVTCDYECYHPPMDVDMGVGWPTNISVKV